MINLHQSRPALLGARRACLARALLGYAAGPADKHWTSWSWSNHSSLMEFLHETHSGGAWEPSPGVAHSTWNGPNLVHKSQSSFQLLWLQVCGQAVDKFGYWLQGLFRHFADICFLDSTNNQSIVRTVIEWAMLAFSQFQFIKTFTIIQRQMVSASNLHFGPVSPEKAFLFYWWSYHWCDAMPMRFVLNKIWHFTIPVQKRSQVVQIFIFLNYFPIIDVFWTKSGIFGP